MWVNTMDSSQSLSPLSSLCSLGKIFISLTFVGTFVSGLLSIFGLLCSSLHVRLFFVVVVPYFLSIFWNPVISRDSPVPGQLNKITKSSLSTGSTGNQIESLKGLQILRILLLPNKAKMLLKINFIFISFNEIFSFLLLLFTHTSKFLLILIIKKEHLS